MLPLQCWFCLLGSAESRIGVSDISCPESCPNGKVQCTPFISVCAGRSCSRYEEARCVTNYCFGCHYYFLDKEDVVIPECSDVYCIAVNTTEQ